MIRFDRMMLILAKLIMLTGIMSLAKITYIGLIRYLINYLVNPIIQTDQFESGQILDGSLDI